MLLLLRLPTPQAGVTACLQGVLAVSQCSGLHCVDPLVLWLILSSTQLQAQLNCHWQGTVPPAVCRLLQRPALHLETSAGVDLSRRPSPCRQLTVDLLLRCSRWMHVQIPHWPHWLLLCQRSRRHQRQGQLLTCWCGPIFGHQPSPGARGECMNFHMEVVQRPHGCSMGHTRNEEAAESLAVKGD